MKKNGLDFGNENHFQVFVVAAVAVAVLDSIAVPWNDDQVCGQQSHGSIRELN